ncbi:alpha/beta fold hydrolase [Arthrobacter sp. RAF14]|uniref:alpha/beta fold hydrolase n=1 Tax=Arthrobacter sp. RAF14 TaxID=3233051 RepID=UPI003F928999
MRELWSTSGGAFIRYLDLPGDEVPIVFIHGHGCSGSHDYPQVATQPGLAGRRRILVDLLGCGYSDRPNDFGYRVSDHAAVLEELIDHLDLSDFVLFGHSAGGAIALELGRRVENRLRGLVLSESNLDPSPPDAGSYQVASQSEEAFIEHGYTQLIAAARSAGNDNWASTVTHWSPRAMWRLADSLKRGQQPSGRHVLYDLNVPRAYLIGENSLPDHDQAELPGHGIDVLVVPAVGHSMAWEDPTAVATAIAAATAPWHSTTR